MERILATAVIAGWFLLCGSAAAHADPISTAIASAIFTAGTAAAAVATAVINFAIGIGLSYLAKALTPTAQSAIGSSGKLQAGGAVPRTWMAGTGLAGGSLAYANTFGKSGKTPNAYFVQVISLEDLPVAGLAGLIINGSNVTWNPDATPGIDGIAIPEFTTDDKEHMWVRFYDGTQTEADTRLVSLFGADPDRPYSARRIGLGIAYVVITALVDQTLFTGFPTAKFIVDGTKLYDRRYDSTAGGDGAQRWADPATWALTRNPIVIGENILRGLSFAGKWQYGAQTVLPAQLPPASMVASANECDVPVALAAGGTEPQFSAGGEIGYDTQPADAIEELLKTCNGKLAEIAGRYKWRAGAPGAAVFSFSDGDILSTDKQTLEPFPAWQDTVNAVTAKYVNPAASWNLDDAPALYDDTLEAADGGRTAVDVTYALVSSGTQVQRLMLAERDTYRAFRQHALPMPSDAYLLEPLDVVAWSSARNGYDAKTFDLTAVEDLPTLDINLSCRELDPNAYDWDSSFEKPLNTTPIVVVGVPAQPMSGWGASGVAIEGDGGRAKAAIHMTWDTDVDDVGGILYEVRRASDEVLVVAGQTDRWDLGYGDIDQNIVGLTDYEVRGRYRPISARDTDWSDWIACSTPKVSVTADDLSDPVNALLDQLRNDTQAALKPIIDALDAKVDQLAQDSAGVSVLINERIENSIINYIGQRFGTAYATALQGATVSADNKAVLAAIFGDAIASLGDGVAETLYQYAASVNEDGTVATITQKARASTALGFASAGITIEAAVGDDGTSASSTTLSGDRVYVEKSDGSYLINLLDLGLLDVPIDVPVDGSNEIHADVTGVRRSFTTTLAVDNATYGAPVATKPGAVFTHAIVQDNDGGHPLAFKPDEIAGSVPRINVAPNATTILEVRVISVTPARYELRATSAFLTSTPPNLSLVAQTNKGSTNAEGTAWVSGAFVPLSLSGAQPGDTVYALLGAQVHNNSNTDQTNISMPVAPGWERACVVRDYLPESGGSETWAMAIDFKQLDANDTGSIYPYALQTIVVRGGGILKVLDTHAGAGAQAAGVSATLSLANADAPSLVIAFGVAMAFSNGDMNAEAAWATGSFDGDLAGIDRNGHNAHTNIGCAWRGGVKFMNSAPADFAVAKAKNSNASSINYLLAVALQAGKSA